MRKSRFLRIVYAMCAVVLSASLFMQSGAFMVVNAAKTEKVPVISVDAYTDRGNFNKNIISANHRFNSNGNGMYDAENGEVYDDFVNKTAEVGYGLIRYPAGTIGNLFKWKDSIGPVEERKNIVLANIQRQNQLPTYGLDEHMAYTEQIGANAVIMVAEASETPQDAADLVEYLNAPNDGSNPGGGTDWAAVRAENGHPEPYGVTYFEIGNEMNNIEQRYWLDYPSLTGKTNHKEKYALGDTVNITNEPARVYGTWVENATTGAANEEFYSQYCPVVPDSQTVYVSGTKWTEVNSFDGQPSTAQVYMFDDETGKITFGDGINGKIPNAGSRIRMDYRHVHAGFAEYYDAMKAIDPSIKVVSCMDDIYDHIEDKSKCDGIVKHNYPVLGKPADARGLHDAYMAKAENIINSFVNDDSSVKLAAGRNDAIVATTEYGIIPINSVYSDPNDAILRDEARILSRGLHFATMLVAAAQMEKELLVHQGFTAYSFGGGAGLGSAGSIFNALYAQDPNDPTKTIESSMALAYKIFGQGHGETVLNSFVENNPVIDAANTDDYNALRVLASKDENGDMYLLVINRDPENDIDAAVNLNGYTIAGEAEISILNGESYSSCNTPEHPEDVKITEHTERLGIGTSSFAYSFPAHSVVAIKLSGSAERNPWADNFAVQDFENIEMDALPVSMTLTSQKAGVTLDPDDSSNKVLAITRNANGKATVKASLSGGSPVSDIIRYEDGIRISFKFKATEKTARMNMQVKSENVTVMNLAYDNGMLMCNTVRRAFLSVGEWHEIEFVLNHAAKEYMMYVDGKYSHSARSYNNSSRLGLDAVVFDAENNNATFYIDDFLVQTMTAESNAALGAKNISVTAECGTMPVLPETVDVFSSDGTVTPKTVEWESIEPDMYGRVGSFTVNGKAGDFDVIATVTVIDNTVVPEDFGLTLDEDYVFGIVAGQTAGDFEGLDFAKNGMTMKATDAIGTGCTLNVSKKERNVVILGDVSGDGRINSTDFMQIRRKYLDLYGMTDTQLMAADVNKDGKINSTDFMQVRRHFLGMFDLYA